MSHRKEHEDAVATMGPLVFIGSLGAGATLAYYYNPTFNPNLTRTVGQYIASWLTSDWLKGAFAAGALTRLIFFNIRDELSIVLPADPQKEKNSLRPAASIGKPMLVAGLMNFAACILSPSNGIFFCSWNAGWQTASVLYTAFWLQPTTTA